MPPSAFSHRTASCRLGVGQTPEVHDVAPGGQQAGHDGRGHHRPGRPGVAADQDAARPEVGSEGLGEARRRVPGVNVSPDDAAHAADADLQWFHDSFAAAGPGAGHEKRRRDRAGTPPGTRLPTGRQTRAASGSSTSAQTLPPNPAPNADAAHRAQLPGRPRQHHRLGHLVAEQAAPRGRCDRSTSVPKAARSPRGQRVARRGNDARALLDELVEASQQRRRGEAVDGGPLDHLADRRQPRPGPPPSASDGSGRPDAARHASRIARTASDARL